MKQICKNCKHFDPVKSVCNWKNLIKLENDWCYGFFAFEKREENKMETLDFEILTENEIKEIIKAGQAELSKRERRRRDALRNAFVEAWRKLEEDGGSIYVCGEHINLNEDVDIY